MKKRKCPFCEKELNGGSSHLYKCHKKPEDKSKDELKFMFYEFNFPEFCDKDNLYKEYIVEKKGFTELREKYNIDFKAIGWIIQYLSLDYRNHSEAVFLGAEKTKKSLKEKFGVENVSQLEEIKEKKRQTFLKHYGVDNIRKWKPFYDYVDKVIEDKYGMSSSELKSIRSKEVWERKTDEQKNEWLLKSIHSDESRRKVLHQSGYRTSKLETRIEEVLKENNITYTYQFIIKNGKKRKFYDFFLKEYDIIIEVNGDYWHANPEQYKSNDIIHYCFGKTPAKKIWENDKIKKEWAETKGYKVVYIWEKELNNLKTNKQILEHLKTKLL
jgi:G:T-mismatch repair DNA endonuclease (very short patch repair protein)